MLKNVYALFPFFLSILFVLPLAAQTTEDCSNGIDDDGDGLIDCYDPDCTCISGQCDNFFYTTCNSPCNYVPPCGQLSLGIQWTGQAQTGTYSTLVAGDMDADGIPDIVTYRVESTEIYIIDGATGATKVQFNSPSVLDGGTAPAIADLDRDGFGEIVIVSNDRRLRCYEHDGTLKYTSAIQVGYNANYRFSVPNIADFDHDGWAEVNIGNQVFNGQTGALLASGGAGVSAGEHPNRIALTFSFCSPVAIDALPDAACPDCQGLEIVAGNQVLSVNLATGAVTPIVTAPAPFTDGFTSIADFDRDGDLDAIVQGKKGPDNTIYVWDIQTPTILREYQLLQNWVQGASRANVADLDGDGELEVNFVEYPRQYALDNDFSVLWIRTTSDVSSITCSSVFDFCGNGSADVIYRGQDKLQVLDGATGAVLWEDDCLSATHIENPLVLDVDADGQTEIVIECGQNGNNVDGTVVAYEAIGSPGIASRRVWNQHAYFNTNINDDLSVPQYQQNPHIVGDTLVLNTFMNQYFNPSFPSPDGTLAVAGVVCAGDSMDVSLSVCNQGNNLLPALTPVSFYLGNPQTGPALWLGTAPLGFSLDPDSCVNLTLRVPRVANDSFFIVLNDDHSLPVPFNLNTDFPVTSIGECAFANNIGAVFLSYAPDLLSLGPDTTLCGDALWSVDVTGNDYTQYLWQDGSSLPQFTAPGPGLYAVTITDLCGLTQADSILVSLDTSTVVMLGPDIELCDGEIFNLGETGFEYYTWFPDSWVSCSTCPSVTVAPPTSGLIVLEAGFLNGCRSVDTLVVTVHPEYDYQVDTVVCYGRTVDWNGVVIPPDTLVVFDLQTANGCDSTVRVQVIGTTLGTFQITVDTAVCLGATLPYNGFDLSPGDARTFFLTAVTGCDSTVMVQVAPLDTFATMERREICFGENTEVFGQPVSQGGIYKQTFTALNGCDSTHTIDLTVFEEILLALDATPSCFNELNGSLTASASGGAAPFNYAWSIPGFDGPQVNGIGSGNYSLTVTDANDCTRQASITLPAYPPLQFSAEADSVTCSGDGDGAIRITSPDPGLVYALDFGAFQQAAQFGSLNGGDYTLIGQDVNGCQDTLEVFVYEPPLLEVALPDDAVVNLGDSIYIEILESAPGPISYIWDKTDYLPCLDCSSFFLRPLSSVSYGLTVMDANGCEASDRMAIQVDRVIDFYAPNAIRLNAANEFNARFRPGFGAAIAKVNFLQFYDRWGSLLYEATDAAPDDFSLYWDGTHKGDPVTPGVYIWMAELELVDGTVVQKQGDLTVFR